MTIRVANVTSTSFQVQLDEWDYLDGTHSLESVGYVVMESGVHELADGTIIEAGNKTNVNHRWGNFDFEPGLFDSTPLVFTQATTVNEATAINTRARNIDTNGFQARLQEEQGSADRFHADENVSWIAVEEVGVGTLKDGSEFQASQTGAVVNHRTYTDPFVASFTDAPVFLAAMQTFLGGDVASVRSRNLSNADYTVNVEEERSGDNEINHNAESIGVFAMRAGEINGQVDGEESPLAGYSSDYSANSNTPEAWAAYEEMRALGDVVVSLANDVEHDHDEFDNRVNFMAPTTSNTLDTASTESRSERPIPVYYSTSLEFATASNADMVDFAFDDLFNTNDDDGEAEAEALVELDTLDVVV